MRSLSEFLSMGGYAAFVWPAYGIALVVLVANFVAPMIARRRILRRLARRPRAGHEPHADPGTPPTTTPAGAQEDRS